MLLSGECNVHLMQVIETEKLNNSNETINFNVLPSDVPQSYEVVENNSKDQIMNVTECTDS